jgi:hypothetical protein
MFTQVCALHSSSVFVHGAARIDKEGAVLCGSRYVVCLWFCLKAFVMRITLNIERKEYRKFQTYGSFWNLGWQTWSPLKLRYQPPPPTLSLSICWSWKLQSSEQAKHKVLHTEFPRNTKLWNGQSYFSYFVLISVICHFRFSMDLKNIFLEKSVIAVIRVTYNWY